MRAHEMILIDPQRELVERRKLYYLSIFGRKRYEEITENIGAKEITLTFLFLVRAASPLWRLFFFFVQAFHRVSWNDEGEGYVRPLFTVYEYRPGWQGMDENLIFLKSTESSSNPTSYSARESRKCVYIMTFFYEIRCFHNFFSHFAFYSNDIIR